MEWYFNLFSNPDVKVVIAAWAATIATTTFLINYLFKPLFGRINPFKKSINVKIGFSHRILTPSGKFLPPVLTCTVTNLTNSPIYIHKPYLSISKPINGQVKFGSISINGSFPLKLEAGQQFEDQFNALNLIQQLFNNEETHSLKIRFEIASTKDKIYKSKQIEVSRIIEQITIAGRQNLKSNEDTDSHQEITYL